MSSWLIPFLCFLAGYLLGKKVAHERALRIIRDFRDGKYDC